MLQVFVMHSGQLPDLLLEHTLTGLLLPKDLELTVTFAVQSLYLTFFANRYRDPKMLKCVSAIIIIIFFVPYTASGFAACGKLFNSLFGVDYLTAMIISAIVIVAYTTLGGFLAASTSDFIQSIIMSIALVIVLSYGIISVGGFDGVVAHVGDLKGFLSITSTHDGATNAATPYSVLSIASTLAWGLGYFGMPHILLRFMAIEDTKKLKLSRRVASVWGCYFNVCCSFNWYNRLCNVSRRSYS